LGHGDNENCLIPTVVQKLADSYSVQSVAVGGFHMAAIAILTAETSERQVVEDDDEEDVYGFDSRLFSSLMTTALQRKSCGRIQREGKPTCVHLGLG
jgi:hypothetical protein